MNGELFTKVSLGKKGNDTLNLIVALIILFVLLIAAAALYFSLSKQGSGLLDKFLNLF